jgi:hypothetical protein
VVASTGRQQGELEIYANSVDLAVFATSLSGFPKRKDDVALWELGSERPEDRFAFYYRLRVYQVLTVGRCAIEVRFCKNSEPPDREVVEFSIDAWPADLDRLAMLLSRFANLKHRVLDWSLEDGELREDT